MILKILGLADGLYNYNFTEDPSVFSFDEEYISPVISTIRLIKNNKQILVEIESSTSKKAACDRCLADFILKLNCDFKTLYSYEISDPPVEDDNFHFLDVYEDKIDLSDDIRQMILLGIPMKLLCREDCKGLCFKCGENLNFKKCTCSDMDINPKFEILKKIKF